MTGPDELRDPWASATWEGAEAATLAAGAAMTLAERLRWLEQAGRVALALAGDRDSEVREGGHPAETAWERTQGRDAR